MNFINSLSAWQWMVLGAVPVAITLLYFLKLKRQPLLVPSTYLWKKTIEDLHVNSLWQRLRSNLLLLLQLLFVVLLMGALLRPGRRGPELIGNRFIFFIDVSASSQATDVTPSRFAKAKQEVESLIDQMQPGDSAMLVQFSDRAEIVQNYTQQKRLLKERLESIQPTARRSDLLEALRVAAGLANPTSVRGEGDDQSQEALPATVYIVSDGAVPPVTDFDVGNLTLRHVPLGTPQPRNIGITAFSADRNPDHPGQLDLFARIENYGPDDITVQIGLRSGRDQREATDPSRAFLDVKEVKVPAGGSAGEGFRLQDITEGVFTLQVLGKDDLALDNTAFLAVNPPERAQVLLVTRGNGPLETALQTTEAKRLAQLTTIRPEDLTEDAYLQASDAGAYDFIIYDRCAPPRMPLANTLFWGSVPPDGRWKLTELKSLPAIIDVDRSHPLAQFLNFDDVLAFLTGQAVEGPEGSRSLISASIGDVLVLAPREGFEDAVIGLPLFRTDEQGALTPNTDWPRRASFPVFVINALRYLGRVQFYSAAPNVSPGDSVRIRTDADAELLKVTSPNGKQYQTRKSSENVFLFTETGQLGVYTVFARDDVVVRRFTVNLFDSRESNLQPGAISISEEKVRPAAITEIKRQEYWKWLLLAALALLMLEWYVYNRRVWI